MSALCHALSVVRELREGEARCLPLARSPQEGSRDLGRLTQSFGHLVARTGTGLGTWSAELLPHEACDHRRGVLVLAGDEVAIDDPVVGEDLPTRGGLAVMVAERSSRFIAAER